MGKSFFRGTDAEVYSGSRVFSAKINASPEAFGIPPERAAQYAVLDAEYAAAYAAANNPSTRTTATVIGKDDAKARLMRMASELAGFVTGSGVSDGERIALGLSVRAKPSPLAAPGQPSSFGVTLRGDGSLELTWKCKNPPGSRGTIYHLSRRTGMTGEFERLGFIGKRRYVDTSVPVGEPTITYRVQAVRSQAVGEIGEHIVHFGVTPDMRRLLETTTVAA